MTTGWQLNTDSAEAYERYLVPAIFEPFARALVALAAPTSGERVLDAACGTGVVARYAAPRAGHVVGADVNAGMLAVAERIAPQLEWVQADLAALPFEDGSFDLVLCQQALQFVPDHAAALAELQRVLAPGGRILVSVWRGPEHNPGFAVFATVLDRHLGIGAGAVLRSPFAGGEGEAWRAALTAAGFGDVDVRIEPGSASWASAADLLRQELASSPLAGRLSDAGHDALAADLAHALRDHTDGDRVLFRMETSVLTGRSPR
jgi:SAM-dependent methyltransferase